jgi:hypothetical protein
MNFKLLSEVNFDIENGNSVDLPHDVLEKLSSESKDLPYFFELKTQSSLKSYVGVKEFTADKNTIKIPYWLNQQLGIGDGNQIIEVSLLENVPKGKFIKLRPDTEDFFDIPEYESCLETKLSEFPVLYQGQKIEVKIFDKAYLITVEDIEQDFEDFDFEKGTSSLELNVINVINTDLEVDINNVFLRKKLEEERERERERIRKLEEERNTEIERQLQKARVENEDVKEDNKSFSGEGNKLSDISSNQMSHEDIRLARLKFYNKSNDTSESKDIDV